MNTTKGRRGIDLGPVSRIPLGQGRCFIVAGEEVAVFRLRRGGLAAVANRCPHQNGPLADGLTGDGRVVCPLHGHIFDLRTGEGAEGHECIRTFPVEVKEGRVFLDPGEVA